MNFEVRSEENQVQSTHISEVAPPITQNSKLKIQGPVPGGSMLKCSTGKISPARKLIRSSLMENQTEKRVYLQYNHTDSCKFARWNAREAYEFMYERPWQKVDDFYSNLVNGRLSLADLFGNEMPSPLKTCVSPMKTDLRDANENLDSCDKGDLASVPTKDKSGRWARATFKILLSYHGNSFDGWQKQPGLNTVQGLVESSTGIFVDEKKAEELKRKSLPLEACVVVAGRTDKGVTALNQVCSFYTWRKDVKVRDVEDAISKAAPGKLRVVSVSEVSRDFHPNFTAKWRRYFYIFPLNAGEDEECQDRKQDDKTPGLKEQICERINESSEDLREKRDGHLEVDNVDGLESERKPRSFSIHRVNKLLLQLEGKSLSYKMFARDTKASRSTGPPTECFLYRARATEAMLPCADQVPGEGGEGLKVMCIELVGNRFLRRMVRVLVATTIREAAAGADDDALLKLMDATCRRATAPPAPPDGLCLMDVGYTEFDEENCLIS